MAVSGYATRSYWPGIATHMAHSCDVIPSYLCMEWVHSVGRLVSPLCDTGSYLTMSLHESILSKLYAWTVAFDAEVATVGSL